MAILTRFPLQRRIMVLVAAGLAVAVLAAAAVGITATTRSTGRILEERLILARVQARSLDDRLDASRDRLEGLAGVIRWSASGVLASPSADALAEAEAHLGLFTGGFVVIDGGRRVLWPERWAGSVFPDPSARIALAGEPALSDLLTLSDGPAAVMWVPLRDDRGAIAGALGGVIDLQTDALTHLIAPLAFGQTGHAVIVDRHGTVLAGTEPHELFSRGDHPDFFRELLAANHPHIGRTPDIHDGVATEEHVMAFAPLSPPGVWGIGFGQATGEVFLHERELQWGILLVGLLLLTGGLWFAWRDTGVITAPLRRLTAAARGIEAGDLDSPIPPQPGHEVGMLAAALERMRRQLRHMRDELEQHAVLEERDRISRDLHDTTIQSLYGISLALEHCQALTATDAGRAAQQLDGLIDLIARVIGDIRSYVLHLYPRDGDEPLDAAMERVAEEFQTTHRLPLTLEVGGPLPRVPAEQRLDVLLVLREALSNVARHAAATRATVHASLDGGELRLAVSDDGCGFDPDAVAGLGGLGLRTMDERAQRLGGALRVHSARGRGTRVELSVPMEALERAVA